MDAEGAEAEAVPEAPPAAAPKRERPLPSPEKARAAAAKKRLKRAFERALASDDAESIERAEAALAGGASASASVSASEAVPGPAPAAPVQPAPTVGPTPEAVAAMVPAAQGIIASLAGALKGTRFDPMRPSPDPLGGAEPIVPARLLTEALAPVLAKHLPAAVATPEGQLGLVLLLWLGPPIAEVATASLVGESQSVVPEGAGVKA